MSYPGNYGSQGHYNQYPPPPPPQQYPPPPHNQPYPPPPPPGNQRGQYPPAPQQQYGPPPYPPPGGGSPYPPPPGGSRYPPQNGQIRPPPYTGPDPVFRPNDPPMNVANYPQPPYSSHNQAHSPVPYGQNSPGQQNSQFYMHVHPQLQNRPPPAFQLSNCQGRKRALLVGINYFNSPNELKGCINDVHNVKTFLTSLYNFRSEDMVVLTDDQRDPKFAPTRQNIISGMQWLVHDARPNDSFFFHYSGHGGRVKDLDGDEDDGYDETIYPVDHKMYPGESGQIIDDIMHDILVRPLPPGCRLTAVFDSCHSGTALDLPYIYSTQGQLKEQNLFKDAGSGILSAGLAYATGNLGGAMSSVMGMGKKFMNGKNVAEQNRATKSSPADVIMFSGCKDDQTSADANEAGMNTGAMSYAFTTALRQNRQQSYQQLLNTVRQILRDRYSQRPQLSSSHPIDVTHTYAPKGKWNAMPFHTADCMATKTNDEFHTYLQAQYPEFEPKKSSSRLSSLYSDFSSLKETNSYGYEANVSFWRSLILQASRDGKISYNGYTIAVSKEGLENALEYRKFGQPLGIHNVLNEMVDNGDLVSVESVLEAGTLSSRPWSSYLLSVLVARPLRYAASFVKEPHKSGVFAVMPTLKLVAKKVCEEHQKKQKVSITDHLMTFETFRKRYADSLIPNSKLTDADIWLILRYIESSKAVVLAEINRGHGSQIMLKFANAATVAQKQHVEITETDKGILSIMETSESLKSQIEDLETTMSKLTIATKEYLAKKQKPQALYKLKQKKRIETVLEKRLQYLDAMDSILFKIESSQNDAQIVQAYDLGANALKSVLSSTDLSVDAIDMTMDKVQETFADQREIDDALQLGMSELQDKQYNDLSNAELEQELAELEELESKELERQRSTSPFETDDISIPTHKPVISSVKPGREESASPQKTKIPLELH